MLLNFKETGNCKIRETYGFLHRLKASYDFNMSKKTRRNFIVGYQKKLYLFENAIFLCDKLFSKVWWDLVSISGSSNKELNCFCPVKKHLSER